MPTENTILDFRSDTVTQPGAAMRQVMAQAEVGDDVMEEDPTVRRLEERAAEICGRQAALFVPSGTMANLIGLGLHCGRGDEAIMERRTHSFAHEVGGGAALLGIVFSVLDSQDGILTPAQVRAAIRAHDIHEPISKLLVVENTVNLAGGRVVSLAQMQALHELAKERNLRLHMDGARIFNAAVASGVPVARYAQLVDTLSFCLSKGLGCPVGSLVVGDQKAMKRARGLRKMLGGGMRQAGVLAACGLYALEHHIERLADDHQCAKELAQQLQAALDHRFQVQEPESNILLVHTDKQATTETTLAEWKQKGILALPLSDTTIRLVTHLDLPTGAAAETGRRLGKPAKRD